MSLNSGTRLGPYEILAPIGAGGMGEVYKARDARLERFVAIKILPAELSGDADRQRRFEQEARSVAALNHPHIVAVYDAGVQDGIAYLVQELVDGESLRGPIDRAEISLRMAVALAGQVADALAAAHQAGIVHRDLKPENIMITAQGKAKVLDFGLARQTGVLAASASEETRTVALTQAGSLVGTLAYMSPEQARGQTADTRSDIFSFGAVFYEMLSGKRAFQRATSADTLSAVLKEDVAEFPENVPAPVRQVALHCLEKNPAHRFQSAQDLAFAILALGGGSVSVAAPAPTVSAPAGRRRWVVVPAALALLLAGIMVGLRITATPPVDIGPQHYRLLVSETNAYPTPRWSPDGKSVAYGTFSGIFVQNLDSPTPNMLVNRTDLPYPFFSPDGLRVWFTSWQDGRSVWSMSATGGEPQEAMGKLGGFAVMDGAALSPDGKSLVVAAASADTLTLVVSSPPGAAPQPLSGAPTIPVYKVGRARLRFSHDGSKLVVVFYTLETSELWIIPWPSGKGGARKVPVALRQHEVAANADWMTDNRHIVVSTARASGTVQSGRLLMADSQSGAAWALTADNAGASDASVSHDGRIVYSSSREIYDLMEFPVDGSSPTELLATDWRESFGAWSRTAGEFVYESDRSGESAVWIASADGSWQRRVTTPQDFGGGAAFLWPEFSPDGKRIAFWSQGRIWISPANGGRSTPATPAELPLAMPTWSPDGRWIAYATAAALWKIEAGGSSVPVQITGLAGIVPSAWSPDGKWLTAGVEGKIGVVSPDGALKRVCFDRPFEPFTTSLGWSRDGSTLFLMEKVGDHNRLSAFDFARGAGHVIRDYPPDTRNYADPWSVGSRLYPSRDGKRLLGSRWEPRASVWILEGVTPPRPWWRFWR